MKTLFDKDARIELIDRINELKEQSPAQWGKMNAYQMVQHCRQWEEMMQSTSNLKQSFIGKIFGRMALKSVPNGV